jgi:soluble lytic murein transglycosylase
VAQKIGIRYTSSDLFRPEKNITLGSNYLKTLLDDFEGNHILATAAYNAGPNRVKGWLEKQNMILPHDIWIETLPFHETRNYIQNVLAFSVIYAHRLGINSPLIAKQEMLIGTIRPPALSP